MRIFKVYSIFFFYFYTSFLIHKFNKSSQYKFELDRFGINFPAFALFYSTFSLAVCMLKVIALASPCRGDGLSPFNLKM